MRPPRTRPSLPPIARALALLVLAVLALALAPAQAALATPADVTATHGYIQANYALARASVARIPGVQGEINSFSARIAKQCPNAGAGSLETEEAQQVSYEMAGALWSVSFRADAGPIRAFQRAVRHLHWSNAKLTRMARAYARSLSELASLTTPDVCGDVRAWATTHFATVPASTKSFDKHVEAIEGKTIPAHLLAPFEQAGDRGIARRTKRLEVELEANEFEVGFDDWIALLKSLGLQQ